MTIAALFLACSCAPAWAGAKLVEYGWDCPVTAYVREHIDAMEKVPFDGLVIKIAPADPSKHGSGSLGRRAFSKVRFEPDEYEHAIADLKATNFKRFTDNFIAMISQPGDLDWFDPDWSAVAHNAACLARIAREGGCKGIMFDPEEYGSHQLWNYKAFAAEFRSTRSFDEYAAKARERGREFIRAINRQFPGITILTLFGPSLPYIESLVAPPAETKYGLLAAFYDGISEAADPGTTLVDGFEFSYGYRIFEAFQEGRKHMLVGARNASADPKAFDRHVRAGFGIWADFNSGKLGWHPDDLAANYFSPAGLRASLNYAIRQSQGCVWVYSERFDWWQGTAPPEFAEALRLARSGPGPGDLPSEPVPKAADQPGYSDAETFGKLGSDLTELSDLPKDGWRFRRDPNRIGEKNGWQKPAFDDSAWRTIRIARFWEEEGEDYDGTGWYRLRFRGPKPAAGRRVMLAFGAADESATVWLNGKLAGVHDMDDMGWNVPFAFDVTGLLKAGADNLLAVRVFDRFGGGGLWKSVKLMEKP